MTLLEIYAGSAVFPLIGGCGLLGPTAPTISGVWVLMEVSTSTTAPVALMVWRPASQSNRPPHFICGVAIEKSL